MKKVLLALALIVFCSPAYSADRTGYSFFRIKCDQVVKAHARFKDNGSSWSGSHATFEVIGYIEGYVSAKNLWKAGKKDWFKGKNEADLLHWSASYCRSNPSHRLHQALESFSE